jgi:lipopolysaccharide/colanic/teichoic acid biosynthesis glycosyltransferase
MLRRAVDIVVAGCGLVLLAPLIGLILLLVWLQDRHSPFYRATRIGEGGRPFRMVKIRSMVMYADRSGVCSTSAVDNRITPVGRFVRRFKLDELTQLWNVLRGEMSLVGPRPAVALDVALYAPQERAVLGLRPGITDLASIVFADEAEILKTSEDPDLDYMQRIRPRKSSISLFYADHRTLGSDLRVIALTLLAFVRRDLALEHAARLLSAMGAPPELVAVARRRGALDPLPPPGRKQPITAAELRLARQHVLAS